MNSAPARLSVVIPAFNEEHRLPGVLDEVLEYLRSRAYASEVLVVNDGSHDGTAAVVRERMRLSPVLRLLEHPGGGNQGKGAAVRLGMRHATGEFRLFMDADHSTHIREVEQFWTHFTNGSDVVIGSRAVPGARITVPQPWYRVIAGRTGNRLIQALVAPGVWDTQAGFKMFSAAAADRIFPRLTIDRWGFDIEIIAVARHLGLRITETPITWANVSDTKVTLSTYAQVFREIFVIRRNLATRHYDHG